MKPALTMTLREKGQRPLRRFTLPQLAPIVMMAPFLAFCAIFMLMPALMLVVRTFSGPDGFTLSFIMDLNQPATRAATANSIQLGLMSAASSLALGGLIALAIQMSGSRLLGDIINGFSLIAANFAGVPLAFAFVATLGMFGLVTRMLGAMGVDLYASGFTLFSLGGLTLVYSYFQIPLMVVIITPALSAMRREWPEAAASLGATPFQYLRFVALPILTPALISAFVLLFGSAFSGYATAYALTSGNIALLTTEIGNVLTGDVMSSPQTGAALSLLMFVVMGATLWISHLFGRRFKQWMPQ